MKESAWLVDPEDEPWVSLPPALAEKLDARSALLRTCWAAWRATAKQMAFVPGPESRVAAEDALLTSVHSDWGEHPAGSAAFLAVRLVDAASQHLLGLKALVDGRQLVLPPWPVLRAEIEHLARAAWILDPEITPESRVARGWLELLHGAHHRRWALGALKAARSEIRAARDLREATRAELARRFPDAVLGEWTQPRDPPPWSVGGETYPSIGAACRRFFAIAGITESQGIYDLLAAASHPAPQELMAISPPVAVDARLEFPWTIDEGLLLRLLRGAAVSMYRSAWIVCSYFGLDGSALELWADEFEAVEPGGFRSPPEERL